MNIWIAVGITFVATVCLCGLIHHLVMLNKRIEQLEQANMTRKGGLPRHVQDKLMDAIATLNYVQFNRNIEDAYTNQLRQQLSTLRDIELKQGKGQAAD